MIRSNKRIAKTFNMQKAKKMQNVPSQYDLKVNENVCKWIVLGKDTEYYMLNKDKKIRK